MVRPHCAAQRLCQTGQQPQVGKQCPASDKCLRCLRKDREEWSPCQRNTGHEPARPDHDLGGFRRKTSSAGQDIAQDAGAWHISVFIAAPIRAAHQDHRDERRNCDQSRQHQSDAVRVSRDGVRNLSSQTCRSDWTKVPGCFWQRAGHLGVWHGSFLIGRFACTDRYGGANAVRVNLSGSGYREYGAQLVAVRIAQIGQVKLAARHRADARRVFAGCAAGCDACSVPRVDHFGAVH